MSARAMTRAILVVASSLLSGCTLTGVVKFLFQDPPGEALTVAQGPVPAPSKTGIARAGVAKVDITPPPGFPTGGHGPAGNLARGHWTRLYARAFYLDDGSGHPVTLVTCDLFALPGGLHDQVAARLTTPSKEVEAMALPPSALIIAATHTHQGPGNYLTATLYNKFGSSYPGFSRALFDFLVERVTLAVREAYRSAQQPGDVTLALHAAPVGDLLRNRSPDVFLLNRNATTLLHDLAATNGPAVPCKQHVGEPSGGWDPPDCVRLHAVDRRLAVLEMQKSGRRVGALVFFAVHPTALDHHAPLYSADFTGLAMSLLEHDGDNAVIGFFNGAEGDITARRITRDVRAVTEFAVLLKENVSSILSQPGVALAPNIRLATSQVFVGFDQPAPVCGRYALPHPNGGVAAFGGGEDDRTILYDLGWRENVRDRPQKGQGPKLPALDSAYLRQAKLTAAIVEPIDFPAIIPLSVIAIGDKDAVLRIGTLPVEASTAVGRTLHNALQPSLSTAKAWPLLPQDFHQLIGLANDYGSYVASRDEYMAQDYMGASTLWGPDEAAFLACSLADLNASLEQGNGYPPPLDHAVTIVYHPGASEREVGDKEVFGPSFCGDLRASPDEEIEYLLRNKKGAFDRSLPTFAWHEAVKNPHDRPGQGTTDDDFHMTACRAITIDQESQGDWNPWQATTTPDDGAGAPFITSLLYGADRPVPLPATETVHAVAAEPGFLWRRYAALWLAPLFEALPGHYRFRVRAGNGTTTCSPSFTVPATHDTTPQTTCPPLSPPPSCHPI